MILCLKFRFIYRELNRKATFTYCILSLFSAEWTKKLAIIYTSFITKKGMFILYTCGGVLGIYRQTLLLCYLVYYGAFKSFYVHHGRKQLKASTKERISNICFEFWPTATRWPYGLLKIFCIFLLMRLCGSCHEKFSVYELELINRLARIYVSGIKLKQRCKRKLGVKDYLDAAR